MREAIEAAGFTIDSAELSLIPKNTVAVEDEATAKRVMRLIEALEDNDDVQDVYANFDIPEQVLEAVAAVGGARADADRRDRPACAGRL